MTTRLSPLSYIHDGHQCRGFIIRRGKLGFEAIDRAENSIGLFASQRAAAQAIMEKSFSEKSPEARGADRAKEAYCYEGFNRPRDRAQD